VAGKLLHTINGGGLIAPWIGYPVHEFGEANHTSFTFEYIAYPAVAVYYCIYYPYGGALLRRSLYMLAYPTGITLVEVPLEWYTEVIDYTGWHWYYTWASIMMTLLVTQWFHLWFFGRSFVEGGGRPLEQE
jgi:hypothetical protein